jgi:N-acetylglucosamine-6-phosphate deacetylase
MPDGRYKLGPIEVEVKDGKCTAGGNLAGSVLTMDRAVRNVTAFAEWSLKDAVRCASLNAARAVGLERHGRLTAGAEASFTVLSPSGEVRKTIVRGRGY